MIRRIYRKINEKAEERFPTTYKSLFKNRIFIKYILAGFIAALVDLGSLYVFVEDIFSHDYYLYAVVSAFIFAFIFGVLIQKFWTFQDKETDGMLVKIITYGVLAVINLLLNLLIVFVLVELFSVWYLLAQTVSMFILASMNFILYSRFVFKKAMMVPGSVLLAAGIFPPDIGGPAIHTRNFLQSFTKAGIKTGVVTYSDVENDSSVDEDYDIERVSRKIPRGLRHIAYLIKLFAASLRYEIIYAQDISAAGLPAVFVSRLVGRRLVVRVGGDLLWERLAERGKTDLSVVEFYKAEKYKKYLLYHVGQTVLMNAERVIVPTSLLSNIYKDHYGVDASRVEVLPNPVPAMCEVAPADIAQTKEKNILFAGRFVKYKNLERLIIAFANIYNEISPAKLTLIGSGPEKDNLNEIIKRLKIEDNVFFREKMPHKELMTEIKNCSVCVAPALTEFNPNFVLECLSCLRPVVVTDENGLSIKLPEKFTWKATDIKDIEEKLLAVVNGGEQIENEISEIVKNSKSANWEDIIERHLEFFKSQ